MKEILIALLLLVAGFVLLIKGADFFVDGSSSVAKRLRVPSMIIGLTIVAMGTSLPECAVSVTASLSNNNALAVSNVVGSNIFNLMVVCGVCTLFVPLAVSVDTLKKEFPFSIICAVSSCYIWKAWNDSWQGRWNNIPCSIRSISWLDDKISIKCKKFSIK